MKPAGDSCCSVIGQCQSPRCLWTVRFFSRCFLALECCHLFEYWNILLLPDAEMQQVQSSLYFILVILSALHFIRFTRSPPFFQILPMTSFIVSCCCLRHEKSCTVCRRFTVSMLPWLVFKTEALCMNEIMKNNWDYKQSRVDTRKCAKSDHYLKTFIFSSVAWWKYPVNPFSIAW